jgi:hypothetical protein
MHPFSIHLKAYYPYVLNWEYSVLPVPDYRLRYLTLTPSHIIIYKFLEPLSILIKYKTNENKIQNKWNSKNR